jgi:hypothetical protein
MQLYAPLICVFIPENGCDAPSNAAVGTNMIPTNTDHARLPKKNELPGLTPHLCYTTAWHARRDGFTEALGVPNKY